MQTYLHKPIPLALLADAGLFTAALFGVLSVVGGPLALVFGPLLAWWLHRGHVSGRVLATEALALVVSLLSVGGLVALGGLMVNLLGTPANFTLPVVILTTVCLVALAGALVLVADSLRDLHTALPAHTLLDYARLMAVAVVVAFAVTVGVLSGRFPELAIGDAGVFMLMAACLGTATMALMTRLGQLPPEV